MSIFYDNFQSYTIGNNLPFGTWKTTPGGGITFIGQIVAGGPLGLPQSFEVFGDVQQNDTTTLYASLSLFFFCYNPGTGKTTVLALDNVDNPLTGSLNLLTMVQEVDSSVSFYFGTTLLGNSVIPGLFNTWSFYQVDIALDTVLVGATNMVRIQVRLTIDGQARFNNFFTTSTPATSLPTPNAGVPTINRIRLLTGHPLVFGEFSYDSLKAQGTFPNPGTPLGRMTQAVQEVQELPDTSLVRMTQAANEIQELPDSAQVRMTQGVIEIYLVGKSQWVLTEA